MKFINKVSFDNIEYSIPQQSNHDLDRLNLKDIYLVLNPDKLMILSLDELINHMKNLPVEKYREHIVKCGSQIMRFEKSLKNKSNIFNVEILISKQGHKIIFNTSSAIYKSLYNTNVSREISTKCLWRLSNLQGVTDMKILDLAKFFDEIQKYIDEKVSGVIYNILCNKLLSIDEGKDIISSPLIVKIWDKLLSCNMKLKIKYPIMQEHANRILMHNMTMMSPAEYEEIVKLNIASENNLYNFSAYIRYREKYFIYNIDISNKLLNNLIPEVFLSKNINLMEYIIEKQDSSSSRSEIMDILIRMPDPDYAILDHMIKFYMIRYKKDTLEGILERPKYTDIPLYRDFFSVKYPTLILHTDLSIVPYITDTLFSVGLYELVEYMVPHCSHSVLNYISHRMSRYRPDSEARKIYEKFKPVS